MPRGHSAKDGRQCGECRYFACLEGIYIEDWGVCTAATSRWDGRVVFEHDGCEAFVASLQGWGGPRPRAAALPFEPVCPDDDPSA